MAVPRKGVQRGDSAYTLENRKHGGTEIDESRNEVATANRAFSKTDS